MLMRIKINGSHSSGVNLLQMEANSCHSNKNESKKSVSENCQEEINFNGDLMQNENEYFGKLSKSGEENDNINEVSNGLEQFLEEDKQKPRRSSRK